MIILGMLKIIASFLLFILVLLILALLIILFAPVKYQGNAAVDYDGQDGGFSGHADIHAKVTWLFGLLKFTYINEADTNSTVCKFMWWDLNKGRENKEAVNSELETDTVNRNPPKAHREEPRKRRNTNQDTGKDVKGREGAKKKISFSQKMNNISEKVKDYIETAGEIFNHPDKHLIISESVLCLRRLWRGLRPEALTVGGALGLGTPDSTGFAIGGIYAIGGILGIVSAIDVKGDFERQLLRLDINVKGRLTLWAIVWPLAVYALSRPIWRIIKSYMDGKKQRQSNPHKNKKRRCGDEQS